MKKDESKEILEQPKAEPTVSKKTVQKVKKVKLTFKENRKFDLHIGRNMLTFKSRETKEVPVDWLNHKDFEIVKKYFVQKGV